MEKGQKNRKGMPKGANRMPSDSLFYEKLVPLLLIGLAIFMVLLIGVAAGLVLGIF